MIKIVIMLFLLCFVSSAHGLMLTVENLSVNSQSALDLGFDFGHLNIAYEGGVLAPVTEVNNIFKTDIPQLTAQTAWTSYNLFPSNNTSAGWSVLLADIIDVPLPLVGGTDSVIVTFGSIGTEVIPEPASLLLMGSGVAGLWFARRRKNR